MVEIMKQYEPYCLVCNGGGKSLGICTSRIEAHKRAVNHTHVYGHNVTILKKDKS
jgi:hypothetical protein